MKRIVFLTPEDARYGFSLTGVRQVVLAPAQLDQALRGLLSDSTLGVVAIDERLLGTLSLERLREMELGWSGVFVVLPAPETAARAEDDYALQLIRRAIGYQVRLNP